MAHKWNHGNTIYFIAFSNFSKVTSEFNFLLKNEKLKTGTEIKITTSLNIGTTVP